MACALTFLLFAVVSMMVEVASGHGAMIFPVSRNAIDRILPEFAGGAFPPRSSGCNCGGASGCFVGNRSGGGGQPCLWFSQGCTIGCDSCDNSTQHSMGKSLCNSTMLPTINTPSHMTMNRGVVTGSVNDTYMYHPWRAPGSAPVVDACGMAGGAHHPGAGDAVFYATQFAQDGDLGSKVLKKGNISASWAAGTSVEVSWGIRFNHGGGYQYRICSADEELTEACFQRTPLPFTGDKQWLRWNNGSQLQINATLVSDGTMPLGSTWAMNPIPRIDFDDRSSGQPPGYNAGCVSPAKGIGCRQFDPPCKEGNPPWAVVNGSFSVDVEGYCSGDARGVQIVDYVTIPKDLSPGDYVVGFRWDCEETAQIWSSCGDVTITAPASGLH
eukprot:m.64326 g.64326  ORF g.64326 m.64326 type:complete len:384 (+) comp23415_c0_seq1:209-1360(+)